MKAPFSLFLALRYLRPKRSFVSLISIISVLGVTLGIGVMILVIAVMTGFDLELRRKVLGFEAHLAASGEAMMGDWRAIQEQLKKAPNVTHTAPYVQGPVILAFGNRRATPMLRGIDPTEEEGVTGINSTVKQGKFDLEMDDKGQSNKVVIGRALADELNLHLGDTVTVYAPKNIGAMLEELNKAKENPGDAKTLEDLREMVLPADLVVTGIFESGRYLYDANFLFVSLDIGQELYGLEGGVHGISMRLTDPYLSEVTTESLLDKLTPDVQLLSWIDLNRQMFDALRVERNTMFFILIIIVVVAAFSIMNTLITVTMQKTREIGIMKALGATTAQIVWVFLSVGMLVDLIGTFVGVSAALLLIQFRNEFKFWLAKALHIEIFPASIYQFPEIPAKVQTNDVLIICVSSFVICSIAAFIPAYIAAKRDPVKALRFD